MHQTLSRARLFVERIRGRVVIALVLIVGLYFVVAFGEQAWRARQLEAEVADRRAAIALMEDKRDSLERQLDEYASDAYPGYVERVARRDLNLSYPGETVILLRFLPAPTPTAAPAPSVPDSPESDPHWRKWLALFGID